MPRLGIGATEGWLLVVLLVMGIGLSLLAPAFATLPNLFDLLNVTAVNIIFGVGLLVVLVAGGIDISFAVAASVVQYLSFRALIAIGGGGWLLGLLFAGVIGVALGFINAALIAGFRIISIVVTIATFNAFFGLLMFATSGRSIYDLPDWSTAHIEVLRFGSGGAIYAINVVVFGLWYWETDRGGAGRRAAGRDGPPDLLFPQMNDDRIQPANWRPQFVDYLYVSLTNATAFSPTDTMPLTANAKWLMSAQSIAALATVGLVVARAVNILS